MTGADLLVDAFERIPEQVHGVLDGLTPDQLTFRVDSEANTIAWLIWHLSRIEDDHIADSGGLAVVPVGDVRVHDEVTNRPLRLPARVGGPERIATFMHRDDPILLGAVPAVPPDDDSFYRGTYRSGAVWNQLEAAGEDRSSAEGRHPADYSRQ